MIQKPRTTIRIASLLYLCAILFIVLRDIPRATINPANTVVTIYVVLFNIALTVNVARLAFSRRSLTALSALYIAALIGFFLAAATNTPRGVPEMVFGVCVLYIAIYSVVVAIRGVWSGRV